MASLKDRKFISLNSDGTFTITELAREILWNSKIPIWGKILRLLQIKSCNLNQIIEIIGMSENEIIAEIEKLRKNEFLLMSPQRQENKLIKMYEILTDGINEVDKTETEGVNKIKFGEIKSNGGILEIIDEIKKDVQKISNSEIEKDNIIKKLNNLKNKNFSIITKTGNTINMPGFKNMDNFGYTILQKPIESLIISYPHENLQQSLKKINISKRLTKYSGGYNSDSSDDDIVDRSLIHI